MADKKKTVKRCCLCGCVITGWGNDPWPLNTDEEAECCDACDFTKVVPARINLLNSQRADNGGAR